MKTGFPDAPGAVDADNDIGLAAAVDQAGQAVVITDPAGIIVYVNAAFTAMTGYSFEEAIGRTSQLLKSGQQDPRTIRELWQTITAGRNWHGDLINRRKDGSLYTEEMTIAPVLDSNGKVTRYIALSQDVTEHRATEEWVLRDSAERFRALFDRSLDCLYIHDFDGNFLDANPSTLKLLGYERDEFVALNSLQFLGSGQMAKALRAFQELRESGTQQESVEYRLTTKSGAMVDLETKSTLIPYGETRRAILGIGRDVTERKRAAVALEESEERFRIMADSCPTMMWVTDAEGGVRFVNRTYNEFFGTTYEQVEGGNWQPLIHPDDAPGYVGAFLRCVKEQKPFRQEARVRRADGEWRWGSTFADPRFAPHGEFQGHVGLVIDITERKQAEEALAASEEKFRELAENIREVFWMMNAAGTEILYVSPGYEQIWERTCEGLYRDPLSWLTAIEPEDREQAHLVFVRQMEGQDVESEYRIRTPSGEVKWVRDRAFPVRDQAGETVRVVGIAEEITGRKQAEHELAHQARHDHLTGLPNRLLLSDRLEASIAKAGESGFMTAVIYVDLDGFKFVNDTLGHEAGDSLLLEATVRLQACIRDPDTLARMGGDEFMLVINDVREDQIAASIGERLLAALRKSFSVGGRDLYLTASLGIAMYPRDGTDVSTLRRNADAAMYEAKRGGKDRVLFFKPSMQSMFLERLELDTELRRAQDRGQLSLAYQPIFEAQGRRRTAFEALLRWAHPVLGQISPSKFIPVAEESGLIIRLGTWVLEQACRQCRLWQDHGLADVRVAVNVSAVEFALPDFTGRVLRVLDETGLSGHLLDLELTETALMRDMEGSIRRMARLRERGVRIAMDDFGTGHSSLGYLPRLPVDLLKIDRSFVAELGQNNTARSLIQGMISLAHSIGKRVVVEGVETNEQLEILRSIGADEIQGFLLGRPGPLPDWDDRAANPLLEEFCTPEVVG